MEQVLLHSCCAPCSAAIIEWMLAHDIRPTIYYYNPNIFPREEYEKRKKEITRYAEGLGLLVIDGDWEHDAWRERVKGLEREPERGRRCQSCFDMRLEAAARKCAELGFARFTTSLASSRWKSLEQVDAAGRRAQELVPSVLYWAKNWRKDGLQERRRELIQLNNFYNQQWCGCEFSYETMVKWRAEKAAREAACASCCDTSGVMQEKST
ncbi:MAG: epoxyqueuosine reductase QueH [Duodenibacillus sp.]|nr:epoxyqueuosine reductase QueH [Duodenibacillus sp.]